MTCSACASDVDGVEVSPIQQRAVLRDLRRALVDPEFDAVVLARATKNEQWMEGYESSVGCVDALIEHLTSHIEGLADAVPPVPRAQPLIDRAGFDAVADAWAMWCDDTSVQDAEMSDGERAGFKVAATHMRDPRLRALIRSTVPARATGPAAGDDLAALREWLSGLDVEGQHSPSSAVLADIDTALAQRDRGLWVARQVPDLVYERDVAKNALRHLAAPAAPTAATEGGERWEVAWVKPGTCEPENGELVAPGWWVIGWSEPRGDYPFSTIYVEFSYDDNGDDITERVARRVAAGLAATSRPADEGAAGTGGA